MPYAVDPSVPPLGLTLSSLPAAYQYRSLSLAEGAGLHEAQVLLGDDHVHVLLA